MNGPTNKDESTKKIVQNPNQKPPIICDYSDLIEKNSFQQDDDDDKNANNKSTYYNNDDDLQQEKVKQKFYNRKEEKKNMDNCESNQGQPVYHETFRMENYHKNVQNANVISENREEEEIPQQISFYVDMVYGNENNFEEKKVNEEVSLGEYEGNKEFSRPQSLEENIKNDKSIQKSIENDQEEQSEMRNVNVNEVSENEPDSESIHDDPLQLDKYISDFKIFEHKNGFFYFS